MKQLSLAFLCAMIMCGCTTFTQTDSFELLYNNWYNKQLLFPDSIVFTEYGRDSIPFDIDTKLKILCYTDSTGCTKCKMQLYLWASFIKELKGLSMNSVSFIYDICSTNLKKISDILIGEGFNYPVCIDLADSLNKLNHFPSDPRFHCFLLDSANRVILIGNPVQNPKIKELYIRTICERLGIDYNPQQTQDKSPEANLGTFSISETKSATFPIRNSKLSEMVIDTLFTSCECTIAQINKNVIKPNETAILSVTYTPDGIGEFFREVYVKVRGEDNPKTFVIRGNVE